VDVNYCGVVNCDEFDIGLGWMIVQSIVRVRVGFPSFQSFGTANKSK
jgi:hypothetical protein